MSVQYESVTLVLDVRDAEPTDGVAAAPCYIGALLVQPPVRNPGVVAIKVNEALERHQPGSDITLEVLAVPDQMLVEHNGGWGTLFHVSGRCTGTHADIKRIRERVDAANAELPVQAMAYDDAHPIRPVDLSYYVSVQQHFGYRDANQPA